MQLKVLGSLVAATGALLGAASGPSIASEKVGHWSLDASLASYGESGRVQDVSANVLAVRNYSGSVLTLRAALDTVSGASGNGAVPSRLPQTFTNPSGGGSYTIQPGMVPLDPNVQDTRFGVSAGWLRPLGRKYRIELGGSLSKESDYFHTGINARVDRDFRQRDTRLTFGVAFAADSIDPYGGTPVPFAPMLPEAGETDPNPSKAGGESKTVTDIFIGLTQVFGKRTIAQLNYSMSASSGYLADPYKVLSVLDPITADPVAGPSGMNLYLYETRPDSRTKQSVFGMLKHEFGRQVVDGSGVLGKIWKFDGRDRIPSEKDIQKTLRCVGWGKVEWAGTTLRLQRGMQVDLGGIGKEYAADRSALLIGKDTNASCLINLGGDLVVTRPRRDLTPWTVGIDDPDVPQYRARRTVQLGAGAIATSGDANRFLLKNGVRYGHILDPQTGRPVPDAPRSVSVAAGTCLDAGMLATFAILQGAGAEEFLEAQEVQYWVQR